MKTDKLLFGAAYYSEYLPYDRVDEDMRMMVEAGMNTIRIAESTWSTLEPQDDVYDFTHIDKMLAAAKKHGLSVIIGTPTYAIPTWLNRKYPDILALTHNGPGIYGHRQNMDITHPGYLFHSERIIRKLMEHVCNEPHVIGYQLDNETKSYDTAGERPQAMFIEYLKEKYPDINEFNHEFGLDYWSNRINCWEDFPDVRGTINQSLAGEYRKFQRKLVTDFLQWQADIVKEYARPDQFITHNFDFDWSKGHSTGVQPEVDHYLASRPFTVAGCDIYHPSQDELTGTEITVCGNIIRSLKKDNYLILETEAQGLTAWLPFPGQLRLQAYSHIANGSNSVMYWHWHSIHNAIESYWKGVLSHDFSKNATYMEACQIGKEWAAIGSHLKNLKKNNSIAVLVDNHSLTGLAQFEIPSLGSGGYNHILRWLTDTLYQMNLEFDIVSSYEHDFSAYDVLVVPALYSASEELLHALNEYVKNGGHMIATFKSGFSDEQLKIYHDTQPHIINECLGIHYDQFTYPKNVGITFRNENKNAPAHDDKESPAKKPLFCLVTDWMELVTPDTAEVIASYAHPSRKDYAAITVNEYGKGNALYLACLFDKEVLKDVLTDYFIQNGIALTEYVFPIIFKKGINDFGKELTYIFNYSGENQTINYNGKSGTNLLTNEPVTNGISVTISPWDFIVIEEI